MAVIQVTEDNFDEVVMKSGKPVLLDFYADWCGPCKMMSPTVEAIAEKYADRYVVGKVNVDEQPGLALRYQVMSIPMLVTMNLGMFAAKSIGVVSEAEVLELLSKAEGMRDKHVES
ncbi:MAG: thioredoxin [bacterium]|nr:thioredoxin [bacterium]MDY4098946.1 thioredoxin [Lachnospiraceae bacterium]